MIPGYTMVHKDRKAREGGGVLLYIKESLDSVDCNVQSDREIIGVDLKFCSTAYRLLLVYRPPHRHRDEDADLYTKLGSLVNNRPSIILGDFNCHMNWEDREGNGEAKRLLDFANDNFLTQWVREPTRGNSILDLVFTTEDNIVTDLSVDECLGGSDHNLIRLTVSFPMARKKSPKNPQTQFPQSRLLWTQRIHQQARANGRGCRLPLEQLQEPLYGRSGRVHSA